MPTISAVLLPLLHVSQACLSAYTLYLASLTIPKLQQYEETSEKAAKYSNTAEHQLHKTRMTQASGALTTTFSLLTSLALTALPTSLPPWSSLLLSTANFGACIFAHEHIRNFWRGKAKVPLPGMNDFNSSITLTNQMGMSTSLVAPFHWRKLTLFPATMLACLAGSWAVSALALFGGFMAGLGDVAGSHHEL